MSDTIWIDCMPGCDSERFTERSSERQQILKEASSSLSSAKMMTPLGWAFFQVADVEKLTKIAHDPEMSNIAVRGLDPSLEDAIRLWMQRPQAKTNLPPPCKQPVLQTPPAGRPSPYTPRSAGSPAPAAKTRSGKSTGGSEYSVQRDRKIAELCKERDNGRCIVTSWGAVEACHIYPWSAFGAREGERVNRFWETMKFFFNTKKVESWRTKIFQDHRSTELKGTETVENMITFTSSFHHFHTEAVFAVRPVRMSADKTQLELEFHWLPRQNHDKRVRIDVMEEPPSSRGLRQSDWVPVCYGSDDADGELRLVSGVRFMMTTNDVVNKPLPDPVLLELQWHMQRVIAVSGAARWREEDLDDDNENNNNGADIGVDPSLTIYIEEWLETLPPEQPPNDD